MPLKRVIVGHFGEGKGSTVAPAAVIKSVMEFRTCSRALDVCGYSLTSEMKRASGRQKKKSAVYMDIFSCAMDPPVDAKRILFNKIILKISEGYTFTDDMLLSAVSLESFLLSAIRNGLLSKGLFTSRTITMKIQF